MSALTKEFLESIGIQLDDATYQLFAEHFDETLSTRVIDAIIDNLDDQQLEHFSQLQANNSEQLWPWLQATMPDLGDIIQDEIDILLGELAENSEHI